MCLNIGKNGYLVVITAVLVYLIFPAGSAVSQEEDVPAGMELRKVGQTSIVVPQGAEVDEKGGLIIVEPIDKYVARTISQLRQKIEDMEKKQAELSLEIEKLKQTNQKIKQAVAE